jgi:hypothetical protein
MSNHSNHFTESDEPETETIVTVISKVEDEKKSLTMKEYKAVYYKIKKERLVCSICNGTYETSSKSTHAKSIKHYNALNPDNPKPKRTNKPKVPKQDIIV